MIKYLAYAACAALCAGAVHAADADDFSKAALNATQLAAVETTTASTAPNDLLLDTTFDNDGLMPLWPASDANWSKINGGVQVFDWPHYKFIDQGPTKPPLALPTVGYYVIGKQKSVAGDAYRGWIARFESNGTFDTSFGTQGWIFTASVDNVVDAQIVGNKAYLLLNVGQAAGGLPPITQVRCVDLTTGSSCFTGFGGVQAWGVSDAGPRTAAYGQRLAYDSRYGLFVAARIISNVRGQEVGIANISADDGALVTTFGSNGYTIGLPNWADQSDAVVSINALTVTPAGYPGGTRVYVAGEMKVTATNTDGYILALGPSSGTTSNGWSWNNQRYYYGLDNGFAMKDAITALTVQRNGKIVFAGWSQTNASDVTPMIMGRRDSDGTSDPAFCAGNANVDTNRTCLVEPRPGSGATYNYKPVSLPVAIIERKQNRHLVVVQRFVNNGTWNSQPDGGDVRTLVQEYTTDGNHLHASRTIQYPDSSGNNKWSRPFAMWMGGSGPSIEVIAIVGTRQYGTENYDATLTRLKSTDSIFTDYFGGENSD